jgi:hypothetical protein
VIPENRSFKIGAALLEPATRVIGQRGIAHIQLQIGIHNSHGKRFYVQHGF